MIFNDHSRLEGKHAFLSPSGYHWLNYSDEKLDISYIRAQAVERGTRLHAVAAELISLKVNLPKNKKTLNAYVNDAIGFKLQPEIVLYYSPNCFGTADAIGFDEKKNILRIHDLKTGETKASLAQLEIYAAIFCLEYHYDPEKIGIILRIYQNDDVFEEESDPHIIRDIMNKIIRFDDRIEQLKQGG